MDLIPSSAWFILQQFDGHGNLMHRITTKLAVGSYGEGELMSLLQTWAPIVRFFPVLIMCLNLAMFPMKSKLNRLTVLNNFVASSVTNMCKVYMLVYTF